MNSCGCFTSGVVRVQVPVDPGYVLQGSPGADFWLGVLGIARYIILPFRAFREYQVDRYLLQAYTEHLSIQHKELPASMKLKDVVAYLGYNIFWKYDEGQIQLAEVPIGDMSPEQVSAAIAWSFPSRW